MMQRLQQSKLRRVLAAHLLAASLLTEPLCDRVSAQDAVAVDASTPAHQLITLDRITSDPEWLGRTPQNGYWADDGTSIYYQQKRAGSELRDWFQADLAGNILRVVEDKDRSGLDAAAGVLSRDGRWKAYERGGDLFVKDLQTSKIRQITRTRLRESAPKFMSDNKRLMFRREGSVLARHLNNGLEQELVDVRMEKDPREVDLRAPKGFLKEQQERLFDVIRKEQEATELAREKSEQERAADATRAPEPWYLGDAHRLEDLHVSPSGRWCVAVLASKGSVEGTPDKMPEFVDDSGYVNIRNVRSLVGTERAASDKLILLDLVKREQHELKFDGLPDIDTDRLLDIREAGQRWQEERRLEEQRQHGRALGQADEQPDAADTAVKSTPPASSEEAKAGKSRTVQVSRVQWNESGSLAVLQLFSDDNKDRWLVSLDAKTKQLNCLMHRYDPAWINRGISKVEWLKDDQSIYFLSEQTGFAHLSVAHIPTASTRQLTQGTFVVSDVQLDRSGQHLYYQANAVHPGIYEVYRVQLATGEIEQLTRLGGMNEYVLSPDEKHLLITHSTAMSPPELWIQGVSDGAPHQVTQTVAAEFSQLPWVAPQFVTVPSRAGQPIHARLYLPPQSASASEASDLRPAVIFIHGAGYLQNAHQGWSGYFREFMFHSLLAHRGFVVLDMDYRASAGYGRDWRTAIYRHMGRPEVDDLLDGREWLGANQRVDVQRIGLYGGSYGGFLTMMALFQHPGSFACGAALRPVTDWAHYNHGYTSNILNTPESDPEAYHRSSPIELAGGLADPLLICHGMVDDNVFFKDTARLAQRLIELKKEDWEVAVYPVEAHGFVQPSSWYDEYRRILRLFETELQMATSH